MLPFTKKSMSLPTRVRIKKPETIQKDAPTFSIRKYG